MRRAFVPCADPPATNGAALWFPFRDGDLLVRADGESCEIVLLADVAELGAEPVRRVFLGTLDGVACFAAELPEAFEPPAGHEWSALRLLYGRVDETGYALAGRASQLLDWDATHRHCGRCGTPTRDAAGERAKECPDCGLRAFPRLSPAVIVLVQRGGEMLLARSAQWVEGIYSCVAGFVEPGESLEEAVEREVAEEVGLEVEDVRYFGSQPWPYPNSLMIGFTARYAGGEIHLDERELVDAGWFAPDRLPPRLPGPLSIARRLVDDFLDRERR
jgi:NAD+ diphosphatase